MPPPKDAASIEFTPEEKEKLAKAKANLALKERRDRLREQRGVLTYAQREAKRRAMKEAARKKREEIDRKRQAAVERRQRAFTLWVAGMSKERVAVELGVSTGSVATWLKGLTRPEPEPPPDPIEVALTAETTQAIADERLAARDEEEVALLDMAEQHDSPADKYQAYVASMAIRMLRDNMKLVRGPRTIRELDALDQLIRRNLGLNAKGGGTPGKLNIDISILNNTKASGGALGHVTIDAETA